MQMPGLMNDPNLGAVSEAAPGLASWWAQIEVTKLLWLQREYTG